MKPVQVEYDIDNNEWLASAVGEMETADEVKAYAEKKNAKTTRKKTLHFVKKVKAADIRESHSARNQLKAAGKPVCILYIKPDVAYDIDNNEWLADTIDELNAADEMKAYVKKKTAKNLRKTIFHFVKKVKTAEVESKKCQLKDITKAIADKKQEQENKATERFLEKMFDVKTHVEQRFIKKYKGADTSVAMRTLDKQKRNAEMFYTDADLRRQQRLFDDNCKKVARLVSRELCQEQGGIKISCKNPNLRQKMYLFNDVKKVTRLMLNDLRQK